MQRWLDSSQFVQVDPECLGLVVGVSTEFIAYSR